MNFKRNDKFDKLIMKVKVDKNILKKLDYEELRLFVNYLLDLNKQLKDKKGE